MLRHGRNNVRALDGPIQLADGFNKMLEKVESTYEAWFKIWRDSWVPKLMRAPKWYRSDTDLHIGDLVYFQRTANELGSKYGRWVIRQVSDIEKAGMMFFSVFGLIIRILGRITFRRLRGL